MRVSNIKRIVQEDFAPEHQELVQKLGFALNPMLEQLTQAFDKNIDFDNLNQEVLNIRMKVDGTGAPSGGYGEFSHSLKGRPKGLICVSASPESGSTYPTSAPFISYGFVNGSYANISVKNVAGLPPDIVYNLTVIVIG